MSRDKNEAVVALDTEMEALKAMMIAQREEARANNPQPEPPSMQDTSDEDWPQYPVAAHFKPTTRTVHTPWMRAPVEHLGADVRISCTRCDDGRMITGRNEYGYKYALDCRCKEWRRRAKHLGQSGLLSAALEHTLESLDMSLVTGSLVRSNEAASRAHNLANIRTEIQRVQLGGFRRRGRKGLLLYGSTGAGKSHIIQGLVQSLILEHGQRAHWHHWPTWFSRLKAAMNAPKVGGHETTGHVFGLLSGTSVLALEEIGGEKISDFARAKLEEVLTLAEDQQRTLLVSTNHDEAGMIKQIGERATSRLLGLCEVMELKGEFDWRRQ